jgi:D-alanyl-D-alanine carboxypeptidase
VVPLRVGIAAVAVGVAVAVAAVETGGLSQPAWAVVRSGAAPFVWPSPGRAGPGGPLTSAPPLKVPIKVSMEVAAPPFASSIEPVTAASVPYTWRPGCPVGPGALRMLHLSYWGFDHKAHAGRIVVNASVVADVVTVFRVLYDERFPIREMLPEDAYRGHDNAAAAADDTSGFNCRYAVAPGPPRWSVHAYGEAIDVNDVQNPYVDGSIIIPPEGAAYLDRDNVRPGMAVPGGELVEAFASVGWYWGGRWTGSPDYQHFSLTGG